MTTNNGVTHDGRTKHDAGERWTNDGPNARYYAPWRPVLSLQTEEE